MRHVVAAAVVAVLVLAGCSGDDSGSADTTGAGSGDAVALTVEDFRAVIVVGSMDVDITVGPATSASVLGPADEASQVTAQVKDGNLFLRTPEGFTASEPLDVVLTTPALDQVSIGGQGNLTATGVAADRFVAEIAGQGNLTASGTASSLTAVLGGAGDLGLSDLEAKRVEVQLIGKGNVGVWATEYLNINIIGNGNVVYKGDPTVEQVIEGNGTVQKAS